MFHTEASSQNIKNIKNNNKKENFAARGGGGGGVEREREREREERERERENLALRQNLSFVLMPRHVGHGGVGGGGGGVEKGEV